LFLAARDGKEEIVQLLLDHNADCNISGVKDGDTPLIIAANEGHSKVVEKLLAAGAKVNGPNVGGWTPLIYAAYYDHQQVVNLLLGRGADINQTSNVSICFDPRLLCHGDADCASIVFPCPTVKQTGCSALYRACTSNRTEMAQLLLSAGADVNLATSDSHRTPLSVASWYGFTSVVRVLLEAGAEVDTFNNVCNKIQPSTLLVRHIL
jgi:ankyrin repeat protein